MGTCPCPRCYVKLADLDKMGLLYDMQNRVKNVRSYFVETIEVARRCIYTLGLGVASAAVERLIASQSWVPTMVSAMPSSLCTAFSSSVSQNIFAKKLAPLGLEPFVMLAVDLMHEFELGVWKSVFQHLIRILYAAAPRNELVAELDRR